MLIRISSIKHANGGTFIININGKELRLSLKEIIQLLKELTLIELDGYATCEIDGYTFIATTKKMRYLQREILNELVNFFDDERR